MPERLTEPFIHASAIIEQPCSIGPGTRIWHFCHVMAGARIGQCCTLGQNVFVAGKASIGDRVKIQNNVSVYDGVVVEDEVFLGPSCVLTNVRNPRAAISRRGAFETTRLRRGCTIGANATLVCGITVGTYALIAAGAVVTHDVPDHALMIGQPARQAGWACRCGHRLGPLGADQSTTCAECGLQYRLAQGRLQALDGPDDSNADTP